MRRAHQLKTNAKTELPSRFIFVDTETVGVSVTPNSVEHRLLFGCAKWVRFADSASVDPEWDDLLTFFTVSQFWDWVESKATKQTCTWVFAHNWNFDAGILAVATVPKSRGWVCTKYVNDKPPFMLTLRRDGVSLILVDSINYFAGSLSSIAKSLGMAKLEMPGEPVVTPLFIEYCRHDVNILAHAVLSFRRFIQEFDLGTMQKTLASQAFAAFRHRFYAGGIFIHDNETVLDLERKAYMGGRSECFIIGKRLGKFFNLDINAMYPALMTGHRYPVAKDAYYRFPTVEFLREQLASYCVVADIVLQTTMPAFPKRQNGKLIFPIGRFRVQLTTPELEFALAHAKILEIVSMATYKTAEPFDSFVDFFYWQRREFTRQGNDTYAYLCKILMNSLYGKFGQAAIRWTDTGDTNASIGEEWYEQRPDSTIVDRFRVRLGRIQRFTPTGSSENAFPAVAAHVTAYGRMMLWRLIMQAGRDHVYYTDTDSLIVDQFGMSKLRPNIDPTRLGALKIAGVADEINIRGAKDYEFGKTVKHKGIRASAIQLSENVYEQEKFISWDYLLSQGQDGFIRIERQQKTLRREYTKGRVTALGKVEPIVLRQ